MSSLWGRWFGYGLGVSVGNAIFGRQKGDGKTKPPDWIRNQTEAEIVADEKRFDEDAKRLDEDAKRLEDEKDPGNRP